GRTRPTRVRNQRSPTPALTPRSRLQGKGRGLFDECSTARFLERLQQELELVGLPALKRLRALRHRFGDANNRNVILLRQRLELLSQAGDSVRVVDQHFDLVVGDLVRE